MAGDFNTLVSGMARFVPYVCDPESRIKTFGTCESDWFQTYGVEDGNKIYDLNFYDPFDKINDITFYGMSGFYQVKLDWCLTNQELKCVNKKICPIGEQCSDHQWILCDYITDNSNNETTQPKHAHPEKPHSF